MASKYAKVLPHLPKYVNPDKTHDDRVKQVRSEILKPRQEDEAPRPLDNTIEASEALGLEITNALANLNHIMVRALAAAGTRPKAADVAKVWAAMRDVKDTLADNMSLTELTLEAYSGLLVDCYEGEGVDSLRLADGTTVRTQPEPYAIVIDRDRFRKWCMENGLEDSLQLMWQTTNAITKERLLNGDTMPDGVDCTVKTKLVLTRGK